MSRLSPRLLIPVGAGVLVLLIWFVAFWGPQGSKLSKAKRSADAAEQQRDSLRDQVTRLQAAKRDEPLKRSQLETLRVAVPDDPNLAQFILDANDAASQSGIDFLSITPTPPTSAGTAGTTGTAGAAGAAAPTGAAGGAAPTPVKMTLSISGGYFQILDFVNRLDRLPRIVVIDSLNLTGSPTGQLSASLTARMFISSNRPVAGSTATPAAPGGPTTTSTTVSGATTTTAARP